MVKASNACICILYRLRMDAKCQNSFWTPDNYHIIGVHTPAIKSRHALLKLNSIGSLLQHASKRQMTCFCSIVLKKKLEKNSTTKIYYICLFHLSVYLRRSEFRWAYSCIHTVSPWLHVLELLHTDSPKFVVFQIPLIYSGTPSSESVINRLFNSCMVDSWRTVLVTWPKKRSQTTAETGRLRLPSLSWPWWWSDLCREFSYKDLHGNKDQGLT